MLEDLGAEGRTCCPHTVGLRKQWSPGEEVLTELEIKKPPSNPTALWMLCVVEQVAAPLCAANPSPVVIILLFLSQGPGFGGSQEMDKGPGLQNTLCCPEDLSMLLPHVSDGKTKAQRKEAACQAHTARQRQTQDSNPGFPVVVQSFSVSKDQEQGQ